MIRSIERAALRAFPALEEVQMNGWMLRYANGHSRRANSVQPLAHSGDVERDIRRAESWYEDHGIPCTFRMTPVAQPPALDDLLENRGYYYQDPTSVQTLELPAGRFRIDERVEFRSGPDADWFDAIMDSSRYMAGRRSTLEQTLLMIEPPTAFAVMREGGRVAGTGLAVADGDVVGIFSISALPEVRRRGIGRAMSESLLAWGAEQGASLAYLQVMHNNLPAMALYQEMGFEALYDYWYRCPEDRPPMQG